VSFASTFRTKKFPSLSKTALARVVTGLLASGAKALRRVTSCFSEESLKRTVVLAFIFKPAII
jgi:hypothetical protein